MASTVERGKMIREVILREIVGYIEVHGYPPTMREIGKLVGLKSIANVHRHIEIMRDLGMIETDEEKVSARAIRVPGYRFVKEE